MWDNDLDELLNKLMQLKTNLDEGGRLSKKDLDTLIGICAQSYIETEITVKQLIHAVVNDGEFLPKEKIITYH